jgi:penicillin-binding protein 1C
MEISYSKEEILNLYASHAPFGGNVVGLDAASWRYFSRAAHELTWSESAALAVLPNAPSLIYPGKNNEQLRRKRDKLLNKLHQEGLIDASTLQLSILEELPGKPNRLPQFASHYLDRVEGLASGKRYQSQLSYPIQKSLQNLINNYADSYAHNEVHNAAAIVLNTKTGEIIAYIGNATNSSNHQNAVDIIKANRSTGSILKPLLYATMLSSGELLPRMMLKDIPSYFSGYSPKNYYMKFDGAVNANEALFRSLNVPFVRLLQEYGVERFHSGLKRLGISSLNFPSNHYGLSLILGGAEVNLIDITSVYAGLARRLMSYNEMDNNYSKTSFFKSPIATSYKQFFSINENDFSAAAIYETFEVLTEVNRPISQEGWKSFSSSRKIAWKTGTSFGNKDAWAIGVTPEYTIGIWVGNADGEGRPGLTGSNSAAPILFDVLDRLPNTTWFNKPRYDYIEQKICRLSGFKASVDCELTDIVEIPDAKSNTTVCPFHVVVHLDKAEKHRVNANCEKLSNIVTRKWFVLPPAQEWYYKIKLPLYKTIPPWRSDCINQDDKVMEFLYPMYPNKIYLAKDIGGKRTNAVFDLVHRTTSTKIYWHLDGHYLGSTQHFHQLEISARIGKHVIIVVDENGNELIKKFEIVN